MTVEELDALFEEAYKKRQKSRCITLSFAEAEEAYNALVVMREKCTKIRKRAKKFKGDDPFNLYEQLTDRLELMDKLIARLEKKLT